MPSFKDVSYYLGDEWKNKGGFYKQNGPNIYLYWDSKDVINHVHVYNGSTGYGIIILNVKMTPVKIEFNI